MASGLHHVPSSGLPLRLDAGGSEAKMVSLADLHGSVPTTPRDPEQIDPLDPLLQLLVQDQGFIAAVQTSQLHAAAATAVRLLRAHFASLEFKRPADVRGEGTPRLGPAARPLLAAQRPTDPRQREALRGIKAEALALEDAVPWNSVRRSWRGRRTAWRRQVKQAESFPELALRFKELRAALLTDDGALVGCGPGWQAQLDACVQGKGSCSLLVAVWDEMRAGMGAWLAGRSHGAGGGLSAGQLKEGVARAVAAMQPAARAGDSDALLQVPLESIVCGDMQGLAAVRQAIELERRTVSARLAAGSGGGVADAPPRDAAGRPLASYFASISAGWSDSDFDSGADSEMDDGSDATDLDDNDLP